MAAERHLPMLDTTPPPGPADRDELLNALIRVVQSAKIQPGDRKGKMVKVPAVLILEIASIITREIDDRDGKLIPLS